MKLKHLFIGLLAATAVLSCNQKEDYGFDPDLKTLSVKVEESASTKVGFTDGAAEFFWTAGDQIGVNTATTKRFFPMDLNSADAGKATGTFTANMSNEPAGYAVYPYGSNWKLEGTTLTYTMPSEYTYESVDSEYANKDGQSHNAVMWGAIENNSVFFKHLGGVIAFELNNLPVATEGITLTVRSASDRTLSGAFALDLTQEYPVMANTDAVNGVGSTVTVTFNTQATQTKAYVYLPVPTGVIGDMDVIIANGAESYTSYYDNVVINRGDIKRAKLFFGSKELEAGGENGVTEVESVEQVAGILASSSSEEDITVKIAKVEDTDNNIVLPSSLNSETTTFAFENVANNTVINVSNVSGGSYDGQVIFEIPESVTGVTINADIPDGEVYIKQGTVTTLVASSAENTTIIGADAAVENLIVAKGNVRIEVGGRVDNITRTEENPDDFTFVCCVGETPVTEGAKIILTNENGEYLAADAVSLQEVIDYAKDGDKIKVIANVEGDVTVIQKRDVKISIDGNGKNFNGTILVNGKSATYTTAGLTIKNLKFIGATADACIQLGKDNNTRYTCNVTISGCTFSAEGKVGVKSYTGGDKNLTITGCTANETAHSLVQLKGVDGVLIENCEINSVRGMNFNNCTNVVINSCSVDVDKYAARFGEGSAANGAAETYFISNSTLKSNCEDGDAVIVLRGTADNSTLTITGTTLEGSVEIANSAKNAQVTINGVKAVFSAEDLASALTAEDNNISVVLLNNIDLPISSLGQQTGGSGEYKLGGVNTEKITIDLNKHKLNVTTTYWSNLGAKNDNALFTIKNGTMTSSQTTGTWNSYDLCFSNCNYNFENVVFDKAIALESAGKDFNLKGVTINETHDYYAMWISAKGQNVTIEDLTINSEGRGIKIDEQYVGTPAKVTLDIKDSKFTTVNKAAILVKSVAGAQINIDNVDITDVNADKVNAVWVDEDASAYKDKVVVKGGKVKVEGE